MRAYGRFIEGLKGRFITGTDVGTYSQDFVDVGSETRFVVGLPAEYGGSGDTSVLTAYGVFLGIRASVQEAFGTHDLRGVTCAVQGVGKVGSKLCRHLKDAGASIVLSDVRRDVADAVAAEVGAKVKEPDEILTSAVDVLSPNAMGAVLNEKTIPDLRCKVMRGNNRLATSRDAGRLHKRGFCMLRLCGERGRVIQVADELDGFNYNRCKLS